MIASRPVFLTESGQVYGGKCLLSGITFKTSTDGKGIRLYDGFGTADGIERYDLEALADTSFSRDFSNPVVFNRGIYVDADTQTDGITLEILTLPDNVAL